MPWEPATTTAALRAHFAGIEIARVVLSPTNGYAYLVLSGDRAAALGMNGSMLDGATVQVGVPQSIPSNPSMQLQVFSGVQESL